MSIFFLYTVYSILTIKILEITFFQSLRVFHSFVTNLCSVQTNGADEEYKDPL